MRVCWIIGVCLGLAACNSPGREMWGVAPVQVTVDGSTFSVYIHNGQAEAIRTNFEYRKGILERGHTAIERASGCEIVPGSFDGDPARMVAKLHCGPFDFDLE
ncbi:hypothetical protein ATO10_07412 [Actibacterium atlanticum]|uniref:Lipoprotein n=2 Tax=Actibacterium atlanticum TaxID=1461693 RepID=A0A058ZKQ5_9RHOB|nr:hypothetical protein ATO10_07412 [Actibacterium atlanticum]